MKNKTLNKQLEEEFCKYFLRNPHYTFDNFIQYIKTLPQLPQTLEYKDVRAIAERLKRKYILVSTKENDQNGYLCSVKKINPNWFQMLK